MSLFILNILRKLLYHNIHYRVLSVLLLAMSATFAMAAPKYHQAEDMVYHYVTFSLLGGEANTFAGSSEALSTAHPYMHFHTGYDIVNLPGADGQFELSYELKKKRFLFGVFGDAHYTITGQSLGTFTDEYRCLDVNGDEMDYRFNFRNFYEYQQTVWVGGGFRMGCFFMPHLYMALGAKVEYPLWNSYRTRTRLSTSGYWPFAFDGVSSAPGANTPDYGFFSEEEFTYSGKYMTKKVHMVVTPCVEIGTRFRLAGRASMRVSAYAEYAIPIQPEYGSVVLDYSSVKIVPLDPAYQRPTKPNPDPVVLPPAYFQQREQLWSALKTGSILDFSGQKHAYSRLSVGVKLAFMINLNSKPKCFTCEDDSGRSYTQPGHIRKRGDTKYRYW